MSSDEANYISRYQNFLSTKDFKHPTPTLKTSSTNFTKTKPTQNPSPTHSPCRLCKLFSQRDNINRILNQGLYNKYTSSLDYYYTKDINSILYKKRKPFSIQFNDERILDDDREYLRKFFGRHEATAQLVDIKNFYTQFKDYPKFFSLPFMLVMNTHIRRQRRLEYYNVFKDKRQDDTEPMIADRDQFEFMDMLGESFKRRRGESRSSQSHQLPTPREQRSVAEMNRCFLDLQELTDPHQPIHEFASEYYHYHTTMQNYYQLYSNRDSRSALDELADMMDELAKQVQEPEQRPESGSKAHNDTAKPFFQSSSTARPPAENKYVDSMKTSTTYRKQPPADPHGFVDAKPFPTHTRADTLDNPKKKPERMSSQEFFPPTNYPKSLYPQSNDLVARVATLGANKKSKPDMIGSSRGKQTVRGKQTFRNVTTEKFEPTHRDTQRQEPQQLISSNNYLNSQRSQQPASNNPNPYNTNMASVRDPPQAGGQKKLLIDVRNLQVDKNSLYKSINDHFKTADAATRPKHIRISSNPSTIGKGPSSAILESTASLGTRDVHKNTTASGNRYILSKRSGAHSNSAQAHSSINGSTLNSPGKATKYYKNASQGAIEKIYSANASKNTLSKQAIYEALEQEPTSPKKSLYAPEQLSRGSKAQASSKKLLQRVFSTDNRQTMPGSLKTSARWSKPVAQGDGRSKEYASGGAQQVDTVYYREASTASENLPSPQRFHSNGNSMTKTDSAGNSNYIHVVNSPATTTASGLGGKYYSFKSPSDIAIRGTASHKGFSSTKVMFPSANTKLQPYKEAVTGTRAAKRRNRSTEMGDSTAEQVSARISTGFGPKISVRQRSKE